MNTLCGIGRRVTVWLFLNSQGKQKPIIPNLAWLLSNCVPGKLTGINNCFCISQPDSTGEQKTKPTQNSVRELRGLGLSPDMVSRLSLLKLSVGNGFLILRKV